MTTSDSLRRLSRQLLYRRGPAYASAIRRRMVEAAYGRQVQFQGPIHLGPGFSLNIVDDGEFICGPGADFRRGFVCEISGSGRVTIGAGAIFTSDPLLQCSYSIEIGTRCTFGQSALIVDATHRFRDHTQHLLDQGYDDHPIRIENNVTVMGKCSIWASIGTGAVVGAHSVVTRPVPPYCLAVGAPARVTEYFGPPELRPSDLRLDA